MPAIITVLLTIVTCGVVGSVAALVLVRRRRFASEHEAFRCKLRIVDGVHPGLRRHPGHLPSHGRWVQGVFVRMGPLGRVETFDVRSAESSLQEPVRPVSRLGRAPIALCLRLDDGALVELAAPATARRQVLGPFLVAGIQDDEFVWPGRRGKHRLEPPAEPG